MRWRMDGKEFAQGYQVQWLPWPGRHVVQLVGARGEVLDTIRLEVRGAGVRSAAAQRINFSTRTADFKYISIGEGKCVTAPQLC